MARAKMTAKRYRHVTTWTRFHLPREKEWPTWTVAQPDRPLVGPLAEVEGWRKVWLGRMVDDPEQAAFIIEWREQNDLNDFQSSPACAEFLRSLPEHDKVEAPAESTASALRSVTLEDTSPSSPPPAPSRFLILKEISGIPFADAEGRVTLNVFLVPHTGDPSTKRAWYESIRAVFGRFQPRGSEFIKGRGLHWQRYMTTWFWALAEDGWVERKFGKLEHTQDSEDTSTQGRTVIYEFHLWPPKYGGTPEHEEASAADPQARESWNEAAAKVMPPVSTWVQERWDIRRLVCPDPPEEIGPEEVEDEKKLQETLGEVYLSPEQRKGGLT